MPDLFQRFLQQATHGSKSTVLSPLGWALGLTGAALIGCTKYQAPQWLLAALMGTFFMEGLAYLGAFAYFAWTQPDALRSEKFSLTKLAMESAKGDNIAGLLEVDSIPAPQPPAISADSKEP